MDRTKIVYNGKSLPWSEVAEIFVFIRRGARTLYIKQRGAFFAFCKVPIGPRGGVMNHFLIEKLIALTRPDLLIQRSDSEIPD
jgi:hypothetical protein